MDAKVSDSLIRPPSAAFYVYAHIRSDTGKVFYVGKGVGKRGQNVARSHNRHHRAVVSKLHTQGLSVEVVMIAEGLDEQAAFDLERYWIRALGRIAHGGPLVNFTDGGEGPAGLRHTNEVKQRMGEVHRRNQRAGGYTRGIEQPKVAVAVRAHWAAKSPEQMKVAAAALQKQALGNKSNSGRILPEAQRANIGAGVRRAVQQRGSWNVGNKASAETRAKMSAAHKGVPKSPEHRAKLAAHMARLNASPEARARTAQRNKMRAGARGEV